MTDGKIILRAAEPDDVDAIFRWENDPDSWTAGLVRQPMSRHQIWEWVRNSTADLSADNGQARFIIVMADDPDKALGCVDIEDFDWINRRAAIGVYIERQYRRKGVALRALGLLSDHCRRMFGLHQLYATVAADNQASRKLFEAAGFEITGRLRSWIRVGERFTDAYLYQRLLVSQD